MTLLSFKDEASRLHSAISSGGSEEAAFRLLKVLWPLRTSPGLIRTPIDKPVINLAAFLPKKTHDLVSGYRVFCIDSKLPLAFASNQFEQPAIFISTKLIKKIEFLAYHLALLQVASRYVPPPEHGQSNQLSELDFSSLDVLVSMVHFDCSAPIDTSFYNEQDIRFFLMVQDFLLLFVILHEIGHFELGHFRDRDNSKSVISPNLFIDEEYNLQKVQEHEADWFAFTLVTYLPYHGTLTTLF